jgi:ADP-glucose pyrophosphorylase
MNNVTVISYPSHRDDALLSLADLRSRYMVPFAGRYRVVDFTLRNAAACEAKHTIIVSNVFDDLQHYVQHHPLYRNDEKASTRIFLETKLTLAQCARLIFAKPTPHYVIYSGDCPTMIDFAPLLWKFKTKRKSGAVLYLINYDGRPTMARTALICDRKTLDVAFKKLLKEKRHAPHVFETIINQFIIRGVKRETVDAYCRPAKNIPDYYHANYESLRNPEIAMRMMDDENLLSGISVSSYAFLGPGANVSSSHIAEGCEIHGEVTNSVIFPGVYIGERASVRDSVILPFCRIGNGARITRTVIDEFTDRARQDLPYNVFGDSIVGRDATGYKNADYPGSLFDSITLVGKNCALPEGIRVGSAGYISSGVADDAFTTTKTIDDGCSIIRTIPIDPEQHETH